VIDIRSTKISLHKWALSFFTLQLVGKVPLKR